MASSASPLYAAPLFQRITGGALRPGGTALTRRALELCSFAPEADILDIGCGKGASLALLQQLGLNGTGLDRECSLEAPFPFVQADAENPPFPDDSFDGLLCECVLSLLPGAAHALQRFSAMLRPEGRLILSDLYITGGSGRPAAGVSTCLEGARTRQEVEVLLEENGFSTLFFEDHSAALKELAARLLWYGDEELCALLRGGRACACGTRYGYGLWIARPSGKQKGARTDALHPRRLS